MLFIILIEITGFYLQITIVKIEDSVFERSIRVISGVCEIVQSLLDANLYELSKENISNNLL